MDLLIDRYIQIRETLLCIGHSHCLHVNNINLGPIYRLEDEGASIYDMCEVKINGSTMRLHISNILDCGTDNSHTNDTLISFRSLDINDQRKLQDMVEVLDSCLLQLMRCSHVSEPS